MTTGKMTTFKVTLCIILLQSIEGTEAY